MGGGFGKYGDTKHKAQIWKKSLREKTISKKLCTLGTADVPYLQKEGRRRD